jgi:branched-subunit amino acid transport protein
VPEGADAGTTAAGLWPYVVILTGAAATYLWRGLGVALSGRIDPRGAVFEWMACIAYALLAGLIARFILLPTGPLSEVALLYRVLAAAGAFAAFFLAGRAMLIGIAVGVGALMMFVTLGGV